MPAHQQPATSKSSVRDLCSLAIKLVGLENLAELVEETPQTILRLASGRVRLTVSQAHVFNRVVRESLVQRERDQRWMAEATHEIRRLTGDLKGVISWACLDFRQTTGKRLEAFYRDPMKNNGVLGASSRGAFRKAFEGEVAVEIETPEGILLLAIKCAVEAAKEDVAEVRYRSEGFHQAMTRLEAGSNLAALLRAYFRRLRKGVPPPASHHHPAWGLDILDEDDQR